MIDAKASEAGSSEDVSEVRKRAAKHQVFGADKTPLLWVA